MNCQVVWNNANNFKFVDICQFREVIKCTIRRPLVDNDNNIKYKKKQKEIIKKEQR